MLTITIAPFQEPKIIFTDMLRARMAWESEVTRVTGKSLTRRPASQRQISVPGVRGSGGCIEQPGPLQQHCGSAGCRSSQGGSCRGDQWPCKLINPWSGETAVDYSTTLSICREASVASLLPGGPKHECPDPARRIYCGAPCLFCLLACVSLPQLGNGTHNEVATSGFCGKSWSLLYERMTVSDLLVNYFI